MERDDWLRNVELRGCSAVPCRVHFSQAIRSQHREALSEIAARYPEIAADADHAADEPDRLDYMHTQGEEATDAWGCTWDNIYGGMVGQVRGHPLDDWSKLAGYQPPSPAETDHVYPIDWEAERRLIQSGRNAGALIHGATDHGFFFQRLYYLRGFENLMLDIASRDPRLDELCAMVLEFNVGLVERYLELGVDVMNFGDDLGMQERLTISPDDWRRYVKPAYAKLFGMCREAGAHVHLHSDGYIVDIMPDLIECGATILNPQDLCNGLENIRRELKGKVCIDLDVDRQRITVLGTPEEVEAHIGRCIETLGSPEGGLLLIYGVYPGTPLENVEAVFRGMTRHRRMFA